MAASKPRSKTALVFKRILAPIGMSSTFVASECLDAEKLMGLSDTALSILSLSTFERVPAIVFHQRLRDPKARAKFWNLLSFEKKLVIISGLWRRPDRVHGALALELISALSDSDLNKAMPKLLDVYFATGFLNLVKYIFEQRRDDLKKENYEEIIRRVLLSKGPGFQWWYSENGVAPRARRGVVELAWKIVQWLNNDTLNDQLAAIHLESSNILLKFDAIQALGSRAVPGARSCPLIILSGTQ